MKILHFCFVIFLIFLISSPTSGAILENIFRRIKERYIDLKQARQDDNSLADYIPGADLLINKIKYSISYLFNLPLKRLLISEKIVCAIFARKRLLGTAGFVDTDDFSLTIYNTNGTDIIQLKDIDELTHSSLYKADRSLTIFISLTPEYTENQNLTNDEEKELIASYVERDQFNFMVLNIRDQIDSLSHYALYNSRRSGIILGHSLSKLQDITGDQIHLIGHSLGAQVAGYAAVQYERDSGMKIRRITALSPSRPCYKTGRSVNGLRKGAVKFLDVIHSGHAFGITKSVGHVDFFVNRIDRLHSGCTNFLCTHKISIRYFAESVVSGQENNFIGTKCKSRRFFERSYCRNNQKIPMGLKTPSTVAGLVFLNTNANSPFGKNAGPWRPTTRRTTTTIRTTTTKAPTTMAIESTMSTTFMPPTLSTTSASPVSTISASSTTIKVEPTEKATTEIETPQETVPTTDRTEKATTEIEMPQKTTPTTDTPDSTSISTSTSTSDISSTEISTTSGTTTTSSESDTTTSSESATVSPAVLPAVGRMLSMVPDSIPIDTSILTDNHVLELEPLGAPTTMTTTLLPSDQSGYVSKNDVTTASNLTTLSEMGSMIEEPTTDA